MISLLNDWGADWASWFLAAVIQHTIFLLLVFAALRLLRGASARVKSVVATVGVVKLILPPLVPSHWLVGGTTQGPTAAFTTLLFPFAEDGTAVVAGSGGLSRWTGGLEPVAAIMLVWLSIVATRLGWSLIQTADLALAVRGAEPVPAAEVPAEIRDRGLEVRLSNRVDIPLTMGVFSRRIFVPPAWRGWSAAERRAVLRHELAHIQHRDGLIQTLEIVAQALFFFHPLVALLIRRLRTWREMACDDVSVAGDHSARLAYSRFLVELAETALGPRPATESASTLARRKCELMKRVTYQVKEGAMTKVSKTKLSAILAVLLLAIGPLSLVYGEAPPPPPAASDPAGEEEIKDVKQAKGKVPPPPPKHAIALKLTQKGILVDGKLTDRDKVHKMLQTIADEKKDKTVVAIDSKGDVSMGAVYEVQKMLRKLELTKVKYVGELGRALPMNLPPEKAMKKLQSLPEDQVMRVFVDGAGVLTVDGKKTPGAKLAKSVAKALAKEPHLVVSLATERETKYGAFVQTLESLKKGGATRIAVQDPGS